MSQNNSSLCLGVNIVAILIFSGVFIPGFLELYFKNETYIETNCTTTHIKYPISYDNDTHWGACSCGKRCVAYTPIISIYIKVHGNTTYLINTDYNKESYTFYRKKCKDGNKPGMISKYIQEANNTYMKYHNTTFECYFSEENQHACFEKTDILSDSFYWFVIIVLATLVLCACCQVCSKIRKM